MELIVIRVFSLLLDRLHRLPGLRIDHQNHTRVSVPQICGFLCHDADDFVEIGLLGENTSQLDEAG